MAAAPMPPTGAATMVLATPQAPLSEAMGVCGWCEDAPWTFSCAMCDPRKTKQVCTECAKRWHSRGFSREHVLTSRTGQSQQFREWFRDDLDAQQKREDEGNNQKSAPDTELKNGDDDEKTKVVDSPKNPVEGEQVNPEAPRDPAIADEPRQRTGDQTAAQPEQPQESEMQAVANGSVSNGDSDTNSANDATVAAADGVDVDDKLIPLDELLTLCLSGDRRFTDMLSEHIAAAVRVQDAITCVKYIKCTQNSCTSILEHFQHERSDVVPCNAACRAGMEMDKHMKACTRHGCPFCLRVRLRKALNTVRAIDYLVLEQKRTMKRLVQDHKNGVSGVKPKYNFCMTQVQACEEKKRQLIDSIEQMNLIVITERLPIFNFPQPNWHINYEPFIKMEQQENLPASEPVVNVQNPMAATSTAIGQTAPHAENEEQADSIDTLVPPSQPQLTLDPPAATAEAMADSSESSALGGGDYIQILMAKKKTDFNAQKKFEESIELAYAIVEASFCSSAKAPRCLLQCQKILDHLQHHLDLKVCEAMMCSTVEFHFAHLSICKAEQQDDKCEYCLRVKEREYTRALDVMESEQREAEAKAQAVISAMAASLADDSREEHAAAMIQLEDELEQAEEYKRDMASKLEAARLDLRKVRDRMEQLPDPVPTSAFQKLPVHFVKVMKKEQHAAKRRKPSE
ncbi:hypothetical protein FI667_g1625, partial [Globisporangium splendens]